VAFVCFLAIELGDELEEAIRGSVQMTPEFSDAGLEVFERAPSGEAFFERRVGVSGHGWAPSTTDRISSVMPWMRPWINSLNMGRQQTLDIDAAHSKPRNTRSLTADHETVPTASTLVRARPMQQRTWRIQKFLKPGEYLANLIRRAQIGHGIG
jgi:hypothetical protein